MLLLSKVSIIGKFIARPKQFRFHINISLSVRPKTVLPNDTKKVTLLPMSPLLFIKCQRLLPAGSMYSISLVSKEKKKSLNVLVFAFYFSAHERGRYTIARGLDRLPFGCQKVIQYVSVLSLCLYSRNKVASRR